MNPCVNVCYREIVVIIQVTLLFHGKCKDLFIFVWQVLYLWRVSTLLFGVINTLKVQSCHLSTFNMEFDAWFAISMKILDPIIYTKLLILTYKSIFCLLI